MAGSHPEPQFPVIFHLFPDSFLWGKETPGAFSTPGVSFCFRHIDSLITCFNAMNVVLWGSLASQGLSSKVVIM